jgi:arylsulfatase A-like enzyme
MKMVFTFDRHLSAAALAAVAMLGAVNLCAANSTPPNCPNLLFILTDDQRWNTLRCMGDTNIVTPHIDRLAQQGVLFQNHFVTTSICCCSRASIFSGQYMRRHGIDGFTQPFTSAQWAETYPAMLRQRGYRTGFIGKFGVGNDAAVMAMRDKFDYWKGVPGQGGEYFIDPKDPNRTHETAKFGQDALEFLGSNPTNQRFCLSLSFTAPHARDAMPHLEQYQPDDRDLSLYADVLIPEPATDNLDYFAKLPKSVQNSEGHRRWLWRFDTPEHYEISVKNYYRLISGIDREIGRMLAALKQRGFASNTVVIYSSDNGYFLGDRQLSDKFFMYEEGLRDPLIICDPREPAANRGRRETAMTLNIDFAPTMLALAGVTPPARMQGRSLVPLVQNQHPADWRTDFFYEHHTFPDLIPASEGVRTERYAYIRWINEKPLVEELFDLNRDQLEGHNLAAEPRYAETLTQLRGKWKKYCEQLE